MGRHFNPEAHLRAIDTRNAGPSKARNHHHPLVGQVVALDFEAMGPAFAVRAMVENWNQERIVREMY